MRDAIHLFGSRITPHTIQAPFRQHAVAYLTGVNGRPEPLTAAKMLVAFNTATEYLRENMAAPKSTVTTRICAIDGL